MDYESDMEIKQEVVQEDIPVPMVIVPSVRDLERQPHQQSQLLTRLEMEQKMLTERESIQTIPAKNVKSTIWENFRLILYKTVRQNYVQCIDCNAVLAYKSKTGTASLLRHKCERNREMRNRKKQQQRKGASVLVQQQSSEQREDLVNEEESEENGPSDISLHGFTSLLFGAFQHSGSNFPQRNPFESHATPPRSSLILSKEELDRKIREGDENITVHDPLKFRNNMWKQFKIIHYKNVRQDYIRCILCGVILCYKKKNGTASLVRHRCSSKRDLNSSSDGLGVSSTKTDINMDMALAQLKFIVKGLHSFDIMDQPPFREFAQMLLKMGRQATNINSILIDSHCLQNQCVAEVSEKCRLEIMDKISNNTELYLSFDVWRLDEKNVCVSCDVNCLDEAFQRHCFNLGSRIIDVKIDEDLTDITSIRDALKEIIFFYISDLDSSNINFVLDCRHKEYLSGLELKRKNETIDCVCYDLVTILDKLANTMPNLIESLNSLCIFLSNEPTTIVSFRALLEQNYNSTFIRFATLLRNAFDFISSSESKDEIPKHFFNMPFSTLQSLVEFMDPFLNAVHSFCNVNTSTQNGVLLWFKKFQMQCSIDGTESDTLHRIKLTFEELLKNSLKLKTIHKIALFLDPNFKSLKFLKEEERAEIIKAVKNEIKDFSVEASVNAKTVQQHHAEPSTSQDQSTSWLLKNFLEFMDNSVVESPIDAELNAYLDIKLPEPVDVLYFWQQNQSAPRLKALARKVLSAPAASMFCRNRFSGESILDRIAQLNPDDIESVLFLRQNIKD